VSVFFFVLFALHVDEKFQTHFPGAVPKIQRWLSKRMTDPTIWDEYHSDASIESHDSAVLPPEVS
jgi:hypothetical protein